MKKKIGNLNSIRKEIQHTQLILILLITIFMSSGGIFISLRENEKEFSEKNSKTAKVIELLIELSKKLGKQTVFEGVETLAQRDFLKSIACDQVQGYFYSKPLFEEDFVNFLARNS